MIVRSRRSTLSPVAADTGTISAKSASLAYSAMIGSSRDFFIRSILFRIRNTGAFASVTRSMMKRLPLPERLAGVHHQPQHVHVLHRVDRDIDHARVHPMQAAGECPACRETPPARPDNCARQESGSASFAACRTRWRSSSRPDDSRASTCPHSDGRPATRANMTPSNSH